MFETSLDHAASPRGKLTAADLDGVVEQVSSVDADVDDAERVHLLGVLESLKAAAAATQARVSVAFEASQRAEQARSGVPAAQQGRGVAAQVALARRDSHAKGNTHLGLARALVTEMPHTLAALGTGALSEWRATLMVRATATVSVEHRREVDRRLAGRLASMGDRQVEREARRLCYALDPRSALRRSRGAVSDRRVTIRPAPDTMACVTGFVPAAQGVAVYAALTRHADTLRAAGDPRSKGQIMADTYVERLTGQATAAGSPVEIELVLTDSTLLGDSDEPGDLRGYGPVPAGIARDLVHGQAGDHAGEHPVDAQAQVWLRRLYTRPADHALIAMDSQRRLFSGQLRHLLVLRDQLCRTPWCDAPIRHTDHPVPAADAGPTDATNGQGLCQACNHAKQAPGWAARPGPNRPGGHRVDTTTPTGHSYTSHAPDLPGQHHQRQHRRRPRPRTTTPRQLHPSPYLPSVLEHHFTEHLLAHA